MVSLQLIAKKDLEQRIASVILTANNIDSMMVKSFNRKYNEHEISFTAIKRLKASKGSLGNPSIATQKDPTSYMLQELGRVGQMLLHNHPAEL
jgi:hypothetical protein